MRETHSQLAEHPRFFLDRIRWEHVGNRPTADPASLLLLATCMHALFLLDGWTRLIISKLASRGECDGDARLAVNEILQHLTWPCAVKASRLLPRIFPPYLPHSGHGARHLNGIAAGST